MANSLAFTSAGTKVYICATPNTAATPTPTTHDSNGTPLSAAATKRVRREWDKRVARTTTAATATSTKS